MNKLKRPPLRFIRRLCADLDETEIIKAEERFWRYLVIIGAIAQRQFNERKDHTRSISSPDGFDKNEKRF